MQRFDLFQLIHKALRAALYRTALELQQTNFLQSGETETAINRVREVILLIEEQSKRQHDHLFPALADYEPSVVATLNAEHATAASLGEELAGRISLVQMAPNDEQKTLAGRLLIESFIEYLVFQLRHMACEEKIGNQVLWRYYSDEELQALNRKIETSTQPWIRDFYAAWTLRGINDAEAARWLSGAEKEEPGTRYQTLMQHAFRELPAGRLRQVHQIRNRERQFA